MLHTIFAAFMVGLLGAGHCFGMCGGITAALAFAVKDPAKRHSIIFFYNLGRISSYALIGMLFGVLGLGLVFGIEPIKDWQLLRWLAAILLVLMGFYLTGWWKLLTQLEKLGSVVWRKIQPIGKTLMPVQSRGQAFLLGMLWGWLPCGLVYSALALAMASASPSMAALTMVAFGLGTFPAVFLGGIAGERLKVILQRRTLQVVSGLLLIGFGVWTAYVPLSHAAHGHGHHGAQHEAHSEHSMQHGKAADGEAQSEMLHHQMDTNQQPSHGAAQPIPNEHMDSSHNSAHQHEAHTHHSHGHSPSDTE